MNFEEALARATSKEESVYRKRLIRAYTLGTKARDSKKNPYSRVSSKDEYEQWQEGFNAQEPTHE